MPAMAAQPRAARACGPIPRVGRRTRARTAAREGAGGDSGGAQQPPPGFRSRWCDVLRDVRLIVCGAYGVAGAAHVADLLGPQLALRVNGAPSLDELSALGRAGAYGWCVTGPVCVAAALWSGSDALRRPRPCPADGALALYGAYELGGSVLCAALYGGGGVPIALGIQAAVGASLAWAYTNALEEEEVAESPRGVGGE